MKLKLPNIKFTPKKIAAIVVGLVLVVTGIFFGFRAVSSRAAGEEPQNVSVTGINENTATVNWTSPGESQCTLEYGTSATALSFFAPEARPSLSHSVKIALLSPATTYYFQIKCGDKVYTNAGVPWSFITREPGAGGVQITPSVGPANSLPITPEASVSQVPQTPLQTTSPTPFQKLTVPSSSSTQGGSSGAQTCNETDCEAMKAKFGKGCSTQDYFRCIRKPTGTL